MYMSVSLVAETDRGSPPFAGEIARLRGAVFESEFGAGKTEILRRANWSNWEP